MPFTSDFESNIPSTSPLPVVDIFQLWWQYLLMVRLVIQGPFTFFLYSLIATVMFKIMSIVGLGGREKILGPITRFCLNPNRPALVYLWWMWYFFLSNGKDFEHNYVHAWSQHFPQSIHLFVENDYLRMPLSDGDDAQTLKHLRMYYLLIRARKGLSAVIPLKEVERIDRVNVVNGKLGTTIETIDLGRSAGRFFEAPQRLTGLHDITQKLKGSSDTEGVELVRFWNHGSISVGVVFLFLASIAFPVIWSAVFVSRGADLQVTMQTAFTVASFMVTSSALVIALIAYLEQTRRAIS